MYYTNGSLITKTFHGVTFGPGETKEVSGIINDPKFSRSSPCKEPPRCEEKETLKSDEVVDVPKKRRGRKSSKILESVDVATADNHESTTSESDLQILEVNNIEEV